MYDVVAKKRSSKNLRAVLSNPNENVLSKYMQENRCYIKLPNLSDHCDHEVLPVRF